LNLLEQITANLGPGPHYEEHRASLPQPQDPLVKLIAFYLPQFHAIPENDAWWGAGFTEWTNVTKTIPRFVGHYQPRLPGSLGFYDATRPEVLAQQAALAKQYGIHGFCFHHYWFAGRRLLQRPLETLLANPSIDIPFCINWANESWTRRWDSEEKHILLKQDFPEGDDLAFARSLEPLFRDHRYIRINGRPLLLIYRPSQFPDPKKTVERWRGYFASVGLGNPYIAAVQAQGSLAAEEYGMDASVGFPPFWRFFDLPWQQGLELLDPKFYGAVRRYEDLARSTIAGYREDGHVFPGIVPSWDNEARRPQRGTCFSGSTPALYGRWLRAACATALEKFSGDERLVFVNAWNEWAEGAYLEPDRHFGHAYLAETRRVVTSLEPGMKIEPFDETAQKAPKLTIQRRIRRAARLSLNFLADCAEAMAWKLRGH
jgi:lipopolysaccharide biosynthesis protein